MVAAVARRRARTVTPKLEAARDDAEKRHRHKLKIMEEEENIRREKSSAEYFKLFMECAEVCRQKQADLEARGSGRDAGSFFRFEYIRPPAHQTIDPVGIWREGRNEENGGNVGREENGWHGGMEENGGMAVTAKSTAGGWEGRKAAGWRARREGRERREGKRTAEWRARREGRERREGKRTAALPNTKS